MVLKVRNGEVMIYHMGRRMSEAVCKLMYPDVYKKLGA
jgi:hypothetical protein